jgi:UDP-2-acetamido-2,6-beta-L-arabino-hexul-4-ose reductase
MIAALQGREHRCEFNGLEVVPTSEDSFISLAQRNGTKETLTQPRPSLEGRMQTEDGRNRPSSVGFGNAGHALDCLSAGAHKGRYCYCPVTHRARLGEIVELLKQFAEQPKTLMVPEIPEGSFAKKLYSTYLSYLPKEKVAFPLKMNVDERGSFTELVHTLNSGQVSINISKPGITKGQHWHNTKWEFFIVVKGHGLIQQRNLNDPEGKVLEWEVSGDKIEAVHMLPGYTHNIINLSDAEELVTVMYCNEIFNPSHPDTYFEKV